MFYDLTRPGRVASDPVVTDLRVLQYILIEVILHKIDYNDTLKELPKRPNQINSEYIYTFHSLYQTQNKIA